MKKRFREEIIKVLKEAEAVKAVSFMVRYSILRKSDGKLLITGSTKMACVNASMKPQPIPDEVRAVLEKG